MSIQDLKWFISDTWNRLIYCPIKGHRVKMQSYGVCIQCNKHVPRHRSGGR